MTTKTTQKQTIVVPLSYWQVLEHNAEMTSQTMTDYISNMLCNAMKNEVDINRELKKYFTSQTA